MVGWARPFVVLGAEAAAIVDGGAVRYDGSEAGARERIGPAARAGWSSAALRGVERSIRVEGEGVVVVLGDLGGSSGSLGAWAGLSWTGRTWQVPMPLGIA